MGIPKWAIFAALGLLLVGTTFWIIASRKTLSNQQKAAALLDSGKAQLSLSDSQIAAIAKQVSK